MGFCTNWVTEMTKTTTLYAGNHLLTAQNLEWM